MEIEVDAFKNKIVELWTKPIDEKLEYSGLIKYCDTFFENRKKTKWIYYKDQINFKKFHKQFTEGRDNYLNEFDLENEIVLFYYDNDGWADHNVMLFTNKNLYYWLKEGQGIMEVGEKTGRVSIDRIIKGKVKIKGWATYEIQLHSKNATDPTVLGGIDLKGDTKNVLQAFFDQMPSEELERIEEEKELIKSDAKVSFFLKNNLTILQEKDEWGNMSFPIGQFRDSDYQEYEFVEERDVFIEYKPEGMRGKRAYIKTDGENMLAWSGPIDVKDKAAFLRGDLEKVKEESQPSGETTVQEKGAGKNDASDDIVSKIKKLKELLDEGILTEEEYQKKKDELVSQL